MIMDLNTLSTFITTVGFPIACCCAMGYFITKLWKAVDEKLSSVTETNTNLVRITENLISNMDKKIDNMDDKVDNLSDIVKDLKAGLK